MRDSGFKTRETEAKRKLLSFYEEILKNSFFGFIKSFRNSFVVNGEGFNEDKDIKRRILIKSIDSKKANYDKKKGVVCFVLRISTNNFYCVEIHKVIAISQDIHLLRDMVTAFQKNQLRICESSKNNEDIHEIYNDIFELGLLLNIESSNLRLIKGVLSRLKFWSSSTYEGSKVEFCIGVSKTDDKNDSSSICDFLQSKYSATISNSAESMIVINKAGEIIDYICKNDDDLDESIECPSFCKGIVSTALKNNQQGFSSFLILTKSGDICLLNHNGALRGLYRSSRWQLISPEPFIYHSFGSLYKTGINDTIPKERHNDPFLKKVFSLTIDLSLLYCGGIISFIRDANCFIEEEKINNRDNLFVDSLKNNKKIMQLKMLSKNEINAFMRINNNVILELLAMDGATCIDFESKKFIVSGYILNNVEPVDGHGGRGAAAYRLSNYGLAIKVSEDGGITLYNNKSKIYEIK